MIKRTFLICAMALGALSLNAEVVYPSSSLAVAYVSDFESLENAYGDLTEWVEQSPSLRSFLDPVWEVIAHFNMRQAMVDVLEMDESEVANLFAGELTIAVGSDMSLIESEHVLPASIIFASSDEATATQLLQTVLQQEGLQNTEEISSGEYAYYKVSVELSEAEEGPAQQYDIFVAQYGNKLVTSNKQNFLEENLEALKSNGMASSGFWDKVGKGDCAFWVAPGPIFDYVRSRLEQTDENGNPVGGIFTPEMYDELALNDLHSFGAILRLSPFEIISEVSYNPETTGLLSALSCEQVGIEPIGVIPSDVVGFNAARMDLACFWGKVKELATRLVPPSIAMYNGWVMEVQGRMGVNVDTQFFGAFGDKQFLYEVDSGQDENTAVFLINLTNPQGFQSGLDAMWNYFAQGQTYFDKEMIADVPVWRMRSQYQSADVPPVAYAINADWLIVTLGDPVVITDLLERMKAGTPSEIWDNELIADALMNNPNLNGIVYRPLNRIVHELAVAIVEADMERSSQKEEVTEGEEPVETPAPLWSEEALKETFEDVKGAMVTTYSIEDGVLTGITKIQGE